MAKSVREKEENKEMHKTYVSPLNHRRPCRCELSGFHQNHSPEKNYIFRKNCP